VSDNLDAHTAWPGAPVQLTQPTPTGSMRQVSQAPALIDTLLRVTGGCLFADRDVLTKLLLPPAPRRQASLFYLHPAVPPSDSLTLAPLLRSPLENAAAATAARFETTLAEVCALEMVAVGESARLGHLRAQQPWHSPRTGVLNAVSPRLRVQSCYTVSACLGAAPCSCPKWSHCRNLWWRGSASQKLVLTR